MKIRDRDEIHLRAPLIFWVGKLDGFVGKRQITTYFTIFLFFWWVSQHIVFSFTSLETHQWIFSFESISRPSPGWILSPFSHQLWNPTHIGGNIIGLLIFGGLSEPHLKARYFLGFSILVGLISHPIFHLLFENAGSVVGASAIVFGLIMYGPNHYVRSHDLIWNKPGYSALVVVIRNVFRIIIIFLLPAGAVLLTISQIVGLYPRGVTAVEAHATGLICGYLFSIIQPGITRMSCKFTK